MGTGTSTRVWLRRVGAGVGLALVASLFSVSASAASEQSAAAPGSVVATAVGSWRTLSGPGLGSSPGLKPATARVSGATLNGGDMVMHPGTTGNTLALTGSGFTAQSVFAFSGYQTNGITNLVSAPFVDINHATLTFDVAANASGPYFLYTKEPADTSYSAVLVIQVYVGTGTLLPLTTPARVADNRSGIGGLATPLAPNATWRIKVAGTAGIPATATAVSLNLTAIGAANGGWFALYPAGGPLPAVSSVNFGPGGQVVPNHLIVPLGVDGSLDLFNGSGDNAMALVDIDGYFSGTDVPGGLMYTNTSPFRTVDMRATGVTVAAGQTVGLQVQTSYGLILPAGTVIDANVTITNQTAPGYASVFSGAAASTAGSTHNWVAAKQDTANRVQVVVGAAGTINITNGSAGTIQVIVDLFGIYGAAVGFRFQPTTPTRVLDTRGGLPIGQAQNLSVDTHSWKTPLPLYAVGNLTGTTPTSATYFQLWSAGSTAPAVSNLNLQAGETRANGFIQPIPASGILNLTNAFGTTHAIIDLSGIFQP